MVESRALLKLRAPKRAPRVRIPPSPRSEILLRTNDLGCLSSAEKREHGNGSGNVFSGFYPGLPGCVPCGLIAAVTRILTAAEAAAIEGSVDPTVAARTDADLAAIPACCRSPKALIWYRLVAEHVFPKEDSAAGLAVGLKIRQLVRSQDPSLVPAYYREVTKKTEEQVLRAYLDGDPALRRRLQRARRGAKSVLDTPAKALLVYRELCLQDGKPPKFDAVQELVERRKKSASDKGKLDPITWARVLQVMAPLFDV